MATQPADLEARVRARIAHLRFERGLTLTETANRAGLAPSTLSRLESGERRLTVRHLSILAQALGVHETALVGGVEASEPPRRPETRDGKRWTPVGTERPEGQRAFLVDVPGTLTTPHLHSHEGFQTVHVLAGRARLVVEHYDLELAIGDTEGFVTWRPHWLGAVDGPAQLLVLFSPNGAAPVSRLD